MFEEVEGVLYRLEDLNEMLDLQSRQLDHRFQLALYKEKKLIELNNFKGTKHIYIYVLIYKLFVVDLKFIMIYFKLICFLFSTTV